MFAGWCYTGDKSRPFFSLASRFVAFFRCTIGRRVCWCMNLANWCKCRLQVLVGSYNCSIFGS